MQRKQPESLSEVQLDLCQDESQVSFNRSTNHFNLYTDLISDAQLVFLQLSPREGNLRRLHQLDRFWFLK